MLSGQPGAGGPRRLGAMVALDHPEDLLAHRARRGRVAGAICDRLIHTAYVIELQGPSLRETRARAQPGGLSGDGLHRAADRRGAGAALV